MVEEEPKVYSDRYEIHRRIARGGMAEVFLARDRLLDRPVAVKVLHPEFAADKAFVERFRREAQAAAKLTHPNIVAVYDWGAEAAPGGAETYFIVMEYVEGQSASDLIRQEGAVFPRRAAEIASGVAAALAFAHDQGVVHRDIKPGNVLLSGTGDVKVADFGIARALSSSDEELTQTGSVMGTATYFSPEQAQGFKVDGRSDLYSLGVVLFEMLTGQPPFVGDSPVAIAYKHVQEAAPRPSEILAGRRAAAGQGAQSTVVDPTVVADAGATPATGAATSAAPPIPEGLEAITMKLLAKNPANRYANAHELKADLTRFLEGQPVQAEGLMAAPVPVDPDATQVIAQTASAPTTGYVAPSEAPKRSGVFLTILVLLLLGLAAALFFFARGLRDDTETAEVPDVIDMTEAEAVSALEEAGFVVNVIPTPDEERPEGIVISQDPRAGADAEVGSTVELKVSSGPESIAVPDVDGLDELQARQILENEGFFVRVRRETSATEDEGTVIAQNPAAGTAVAPGSTVTITVSKGPETTTTTSTTLPPSTTTTVAPTTSSSSSTTSSSTTSSTSSSSVPPGG